MDAEPAVKITRRDGTGALGVASAVLTVASGYLYGWFGIHAFWGMAALCAMALPLVLGLASDRDLRKIV